MDSRHNALSNWVADQFNVPSVNLEMVSGDASFRCYWRCAIDGKSWIVMDAPPEKEDSHSFVAIAKHWFKHGILVPEIRYCDLSQGFLVLSDQGDKLLLSALKPESPDVKMGTHYYAQAMSALLKIQQVPIDQDYALPLYDSALLQREMALFPDWLLTKKLGLALSQSDIRLLQTTFELLEKNALDQPQVPVHRDYHARNLMVLKDDSLGVLDFQDAVLGPVTYDLVSLLRDCYIVWPDEQVESWCQQYFELASEKGILTGGSFSEFKRQFDWMGIQRHLKASGIFARLSLRDGKHGYLADIPRTVDYIYRVSSCYGELSEFSAWLKDAILPLVANMDDAA